MEISKLTILIINLVGLSCILGLSILLFITRKHFKGGVGMVIVMITTTMPIYIYNLCYLRGWFEAGSCVAPFAYAAGTSFIPAVWLFIHRYFNPGEKFCKIRLIHFIPAIFCTIIYGGYIASFPAPERAKFLIFKSTHFTGWIECLNLICLFFQGIVYGNIIRIYLRRVNKYIGNQFSEIEWSLNLWNSMTPFIMVIIFIISLLCHHILKGSYVALLPIADIIVLFYFTQHSLKNLHSTDKSVATTPISCTKFDDIINNQSMLEAPELRNIADKTLKFLNSTKSYLNPQLTINDIADEVGESCTNINHAIQKYYNSDFIGFINKCRIERAKAAITNDPDKEQTIDMLTYQSGFLSQSTFLSTFQIITGKSLYQFRKELKQKSQSDK